ncbi:MAG: hypothetical protein R2778_03065 [Saprospiraceae bacterium]
MERQNQVKLLLELIWWLFTAAIVWAVLTPVYKAMYVWPFHTRNIVFIVVLITITRYVFLLKHTFLAKQQVLKIALLLLMFPVTFLLIDSLNDFIVYIEDQTWEPLTGHLPLQEKQETEKYLWNEMLFFGVGSIVSAPVFAIRLMMSIWRTRNRGTV